jgi:hypothetical protein
MVVDSYPYNGQSVGKPFFYVLQTPVDLNSVNKRKVLNSRGLRVTLYCR